MNWSLGALTAEVPLGVVTVTSTVPVPAGEVTVRLVAVTTLIEVPGLVPKSTAVAPVKLVPLTVTEVPPPAGPLFGLTPVTVGGGVVGVGAGQRGGRPPPVVITVTETVPVPAGTVTVRRCRWPR